MSLPGMRQAPCYAFIVTDTGQIWILTTQGYAWTASNLVAAAALLVEKGEKLDWASLTYCLPSLDLPSSAEVVGPKLGDGLSSALVDKVRLSNVLFSQWMVEHGNDSVEDLKLIHEQLKLLVEHQVEEALCAFRGHLAERFGFDLTGVLELDILNTLHGEHQLERRQFLSTFPALGRKVFTHDAASFWRALRSTIDARKSPVKALSELWDVKQSTVRSLRGLEGEVIGSYFCSHLEELCRLLDQIPPEHHPKTSALWLAFQNCYTTSKEAFGQSEAARLVIAAKLRHDLKCLANSESGLGVRFGIDEARAIDRLRQGLIGTVYAAVQQDAGTNELKDGMKAGIHLRVDKFLGAFSWQRLLSLAKKWARSLQLSLESRKAELEFIQSKGSYFDFLAGTFSASNGYLVETLGNAASLRAQGDAMRICLRQVTVRSGYVRDCSAAKATILAVRDPAGRLQSTAELGIRLWTKDTGGILVGFETIQHQGLDNREPPEGARTALQEILIELGKPRLQERALEGVRLCAARSRTKKGIDKTDVTLTIGGEDAFDRTFGDKSQEIWSRLSG